MKKDTQPIYVGPQRIMAEWGVSRATAYNIIRKMNDQLKQEHPSALVIPGKINRTWYEQACLQTHDSKEAI